MNELIVPFKRQFFDGTHSYSYIGTGELGGKAQGLASIKNTLKSFSESNPISDIFIDIPQLTVITTKYFDVFMKQNKLFDIAQSGLSDERIAHHFQKAELPVELTGDLWGLISKIHTPLAIRSSSLLEDMIDAPFAGVYETKMIPNNQADSSTRYKKLVEAIKYIYASTYFSNAKSYMKATKNKLESEKMAVIIQEVVGNRHYDRFYPNISGIIRSYNFYPFGHANPEDGLVSLALGLGKTIVEGGNIWSYSPSYPQSIPPFNTTRELLNNTQTEFWAVNMGAPPVYDPVKETEYLVKSGFEEAEYDNTLKYIASTYDMTSDQIFPGVGNKGARILNFAPILEIKLIRLNDFIANLLEFLEQKTEEKLEIEFAMNFKNRDVSQHRFGFLQVRPIAMSTENVEIREAELIQPNVLLASDGVMGNGIKKEIMDVVYLKPDCFDIKHSKIIADEIADINRKLIDTNLPYLLIGFGRWGSSDPWLGIPVNWGQISGASVIVESTQQGLAAELSQGAHFFHNISNLKKFYFSIKSNSVYKIDWLWLQRQKIVEETEFVRHVRLISTLTVKVDGRSNQGVIFR